jgi:O-acetyl-ADP-ribose deacetylase (regulator of RNase III)
MIIEGHGNLLTAEAEALVNTVNTVGVMGKGIALQFKRAYPGNYRDYKTACARGEVRLGQMHVFDTGRMGHGRIIINFPTKEHWRSRSRLADVASGLEALIDVVRDRGISSIAIPALGCGNGGLAWDEVRPMIEAAVARMPGVTALVYPPEGAPDPATMPVATKTPAMTGRVAVLLVALDRYLQHAQLQEVRDGISELEIQKVAYFLQVLGAPLNLRFARGTCGPYSEDLTHLLSAIEGHYLVGLGDRSAPVSQLRPINFTPDTIEQATAALASQPAGTERLHALLDLVDGFETPYSLELLATVHFAAMQEPPSREPRDLNSRVTAWSLRKARLFTEQHVGLAADRLIAHELMPTV